MRSGAFILFVSILSWSKSYSQINVRFNPTFSQIGKVRTERHKTDTAWRTFTGTFYDQKRKINLFVISEFEKGQAALTWHGHSRIYFFTKNKKLFASVDVGMPEELPFKLTNNTFYFHGAKKDRQKLYKNTLETLLPVFCTDISGCNDVVFE